MVKTNNKKIKLIRFYKSDLIGQIIRKRKLLIIKLFLNSLLNLKSKFKLKKKNFYRIGLVDQPFYSKTTTKWGKYFLKRRVFRYFYGFLKIKVIKKIIKKSLKHKNALNYFIYLMESRLETILFRLNIVKSIRMARQLIIHGNILVNGKPIRSPSYNLKKNDILTFKKNLIIPIKRKIYQNILSNNWLYCFIPNYIEYSLDNLNFKFLQLNIYDVPFFFQSDSYSFLDIMNFYNKNLF